MRPAVGFTTTPLNVALTLPVGGALHLTNTSSTDELCDELMLHTFECDACISGQEETCATFCKLHDQIEQAGGATRGSMLAV